MSIDVGEDASVRTSKKPTAINRLKSKIGQEPDFQVLSVLGQFIACVKIGQNSYSSAEYTSTADAARESAAATALQFL